MAPAAPPAAKPSVLHRNITGLAIAAGVVLLVIVLVAVFMHAIVSGSGIYSDRYRNEANQASQIREGYSLSQVEAIMGRPPARQTTSIDGSVTYDWKNPDGSYVVTITRNGAVDREGGMYIADHETASSRFAVGSVGMVAVMAAFTAVVFGACLFFATRMFGYSITAAQVVIFAVVTGVVTMVPVIGWLLALIVGASLIERWSSAGWWTSLLIILVAGFIAGGVNAAVFGLGSGLGLAL